MKTITLSQNEKFSEYIEIITDRQLTDKELWKKCVEVFSSGIDDRDDGWRGEYWGKMMRGACLIYSVNRRSDLYDTLEWAVNALLAKQEACGRLSTYTPENEFRGWDMWSRKYVMTGLQHFYDICKSDELKGKIMAALKAHADYIIEKTGKGKIEILQTGSFWGGVNSASILEPFVRLYKDTGCKKYLDYAEYIIDTGGCRDGNLIGCALNGVDAYKFPEQKAYETMSFFEGLLAYYEVTGSRKYLDAVCNFAKSVLKTDVTVIGSCGCTHELFDNSALAQTEATGKIMQETCVTVTLIRFLSRLSLITDDKALTDTIRLASLNALAGALNINGFEQFSNEKKQYLKGLLFDSYSPLCDSKRGLGIGGFKTFADGSYFGCCACIASAGFALYPLMSVTNRGNEFTVNYLVNGVYDFTTDSGTAKITVDGDSVIFESELNAGFTLRITNGDFSTLITASADNLNKSEIKGYTVFTGSGNVKAAINLKVEQLIKETILNGKHSFSLGGRTLAADSANNDAYRPGEPTEFLRNVDGSIIFEAAAARGNEVIRLNAKTERGNVILTDYAAAGQDGKSTVTVWFS